MTGIILDSGIKQRLQFFLDASTREALMRYDRDGMFTGEGFLPDQRDRVHTAAILLGHGTAEALLRAEGSLA